MTDIMQGCDLSTYQGGIDFGKLKNKVQFAILRAGYGRLARQKDNRFEEYYSGCKANGIHCGVYWYSYAMNEDEARQEAQACLEVIKGKQFDMPIYYDVEENKQFALGKAKVSAIVKAFLEVVEAAGYWVGLYSSTSALNSYIDTEIKHRYAIWVAHWGVNAPTYTGSYGVWQYSEKGRLDGISGNVDLDYCYFDYPCEIKARGLNGYAPEPVSDNQGNSSGKEISVLIRFDGKEYKGTLKEGE